MEEYVNLLIPILTAIFGIPIIVLKESIIRKSKRNLFLQFLMKSDAVKKSNDL